MSSLELLVPFTLLVVLTKNNVELEEGPKVQHTALKVRIHVVIRNSGFTYSKIA